MKLQAHKLYKVIQRKVFSKEECEKILSVETTPAPFVTYDHYDKLNIIVQNEKNKWVRDRIEKEVLDINKKFYNYRDVYLHNDLGLRVYKKGDSYKWHTDNFQGQRLSISIILNDGYEGGQLNIFTGEFIQPKKQVGVMTVWPPFLFHSVDEITKGSRTALITFLQGPRFEFFNG